MPSGVPTNYMSGVQYMPAQTTTTGDPTREASSAKHQVIDGTPSRVAAIGLLSLAIIVGFKWSNIKFNVAVGN